MVITPGWRSRLATRLVTLSLAPSAQAALSQDLMAPVSRHVVPRRMPALEALSPPMEVVVLTMPDQAPTAHSITILARTLMLSPIMMVLLDIPPRMKSTSLARTWISLLHFALVRLPTIPSPEGIPSSKTVYLPKDLRNMIGIQC